MFIFLSSVMDNAKPGSYAVYDQFPSEKWVSILWEGLAALIAAGCLSHMIQFPDGH
jgi:hypothetical protein